MVALASTVTAAPQPNTYFTNMSMYAMNRVKDTYGLVQVPLGNLTNINYQFTRLELRGVQFLLPNGQTVEPKDVTCQIYKDKFGTQPGNANFKKGTPPEIGLLNPVL
ncbi:hypothetical protein ACLX1H_000665 [Fusarium chlamydosporum]